MLFVFLGGPGLCRRTKKRITYHRKSVHILCLVPPILPFFPQGAKEAGTAVLPLRIISAFFNEHKKVSMHKKHSLAVKNTGEGSGDPSKETSQHTGQQQKKSCFVAGSFQTKSVLFVILTVHIFLWCNVHVSEPERLPQSPSQTCEEACPCSRLLESEPRGSGPTCRPRWTTGRFSRASSLAPSGAFWMPPPASPLLACLPPPASSPPLALVHSRLPQERSCVRSNTGSRPSH